MKFLFEKKQGLCLLRRIMAETGNEQHTICNKKIALLNAHMSYQVVCRETQGRRRMFED